MASFMAEGSNNYTCNISYLSTGALNISVECEVSGDVSN